MMWTQSLLFAIVSATCATAATGLPAKRASTGCGVEHWFNGITHFHSLTSSGRERKYSIQTPGDYDENQAYPLVLGFHGSESIGTWFELDTKMSQDRFSAGKIMVYPDGIDGSWAGANYSTLSVQEDLQFVSDLLGFLRSDYCVDESRIYATGISNGGGFVNAIACSAVGGEFAALAPHSGAYYPGVDENCAPARSPLPVLSFHGGNDQSVFYEGGTGPGGPLPAIPDWIARWVERNGCSDEKIEDSFEGDVHHHTWTCGGKEASLEHYKIDSMGHCWASTEINFSQIAAGEGPTHVDASAIIMAFFDGFQKP